VKHVPGETRVYISDGVNAVSRKDRNYFKPRVDEKVGYSNSHAWFKNRLNA